MVSVQVKLYGTLRQYRPESAGGAPHHPFSVELTPGDTVADLMAQLEIPEGLTAVISINRENSSPDTPLPHNAQVSLFPPTAGGA